MPNVRQIFIGIGVLTLAAVLAGPSVTATTRPGAAAAAEQSSGTPAPQGARSATPQASPSTAPRPDFFPWWKDADVIKQVGVTPAQVASIDKLYERRLKQIQLNVGEFEKQRTELDRMMSERAVKPDEIELQALKMLTPKVQIDISRFKMLYEMSRLMSAEQNKKLQDVNQRRQQQRREQGDRGRGRNPSGK